jgi:phospholipid transport system substrate-binding protein
VIEFRSLRAAPADTEVTVKSVVKQSGTAPVSLDYDMEKTPTGWKVYDIKVAGVSLVTTYRESFSERIREDGVDGLIKALEEKNRQGDSRSAAPRT